jgi:molecular chaperone DnaK
MERALRDVMAGDDYRGIRNAIDALNQGSMRLAELMMDTAVSSALRGKTMEETNMGEGPAAPHPIGKAEFE